MSQRPASNEYAPYYDVYIQQVKSEQILEALTSGQSDTLALMDALTPEQWDFRYGPDKWTVKEVFLHIIDTERIFAYRALRVGRHDTAPLQGFDQNDYVPHYRAAERTGSSIRAEYLSVRAASLSLFPQFNDADLQAMGSASNHPVSCRSLGYMIAGHEQHHLRILRERYLV